MNNEKSIWPNGELPGPDTLAKLYSLAYEELRRRATRIMQSDPNVSLNPTALVHEVWFKLAKSEGLAVESQQHLVNIAVRAMRQILVEAARYRKAEKRGNGAVFVEFSEDLAVAPRTSTDVLELHQALEDFERTDPRQAKIVELKFFGGLSNSEIATLLGVSETTVERDWRAAKGWLFQKLKREKPKS